MARHSAIDKNVEVIMDKKSIFEKINLILSQTNKIVVCQSKIVMANRKSQRKVDFLYLMLVRPQMY